MALTQRGGVLRPDGFHAGLLFVGTGAGGSGYISSAVDTAAGYQLMNRPAGSEAVCTLALTVLCIQE